MADSKLPLWWLSFVDEEQDESRGVAIVRAGSFLGAVARSRELGINPGGQLKGFEAPVEYESVLAPFEDKHLTAAEARELAEKAPDGG